MQFILPYMDGFALESVERPICLLETMKGTPFKHFLKKDLDLETNRSQSYRGPRTVNGPPQGKKHIYFAALLLSPVCDTVEEYFQQIHLKSIIFRAVVQSVCFCGCRVLGA